jgi:hypothetical protein
MVKKRSSASRRPRGPKPDRRRALELLASCRDGCTETIMLAHGFTIAQTVMARLCLLSGVNRKTCAQSEPYRF